MKAADASGAEAKTPMPPQDPPVNSTTKPVNSTTKKVQKRGTETVAKHLDPSEMVYSSELQRKVHWFMRQTYYEMGLGSVVLFNIVLMVLDVDNSRACASGDTCKLAWIETVDYLLLVVYTVDVCLSLFAQRRCFFVLILNWVDLVIVILGYFEILAAAFMSGSSSGLGLIRMCRIVRLIRIEKLLRPIPTLHRLIVGFVFTMKAIVYGFLMILLLCLVWSIIILQTFDMLEADNLFANDSRFGGYWCEDAMHNTVNTMFLLWQTMITGDSWGACTLPVILHSPSMYWVYAAAFMCVSVGFQNLILAVIVEQASNKSEEDAIATKFAEKAEREAEIKDICMTFEGLDGDASGALSLTELLAGFDAMPDLQNKLLMKFGIDRADLAQIVKCFDRDDSGEVLYEEVADALLRSQRQEETTQLMMIQSELTKLMAQVTRIENKLEDAKQGASNVMESKAQGASNVMERAPISLTVPGMEVAKKTSASLKQELEVDSAELRLQHISGMLQQQSLTLAEETQKLTASLSQLTAIGLQLQALPHQVRVISQPSTAKPIARLCEEIRNDDQNEFPHGIERLMKEDAAPGSHKAFEAASHLKTGYDIREPVN